MRNGYCRPKNGAGDRRKNAYAYIQASLERMFREQDEEKQNLQLSLKTCVNYPYHLFENFALSKQ